MTNSNIISAQKALPNGSRIFVTPVSESDTGVVSFRTYAAKVTRAGNVTLQDVTEALKSIEGADLKHRGRPRTEAVLRAKSDGKNRPALVLAHNVAGALYGDKGKLTVQEL